MDSFELNKIAGAVLFTCLLTLGLSIVAEEVFHTEAPEQPGYAIAIPEGGAGGEGGEEEAGPDLGTLLASADPAEGEGATRACQTCHTFGQGEPAKVGPNLYNVVGGPIGHMDGFSYSAAFQELHDAGETWSYEGLDEFLANPRGAINGTSMSFAGVRDPQDRANILAYLASISENPPAPPEPAAEGGDEEAAAEGEEPAEGEAPAEGEEAPADGEAASEEGTPAEAGAENAGDESGEAQSPEDAAADPVGEQQETVPADEGAAAAGSDDETAPAGEETDGAADDQQAPADDDAAPADEAPAGNRAEEATDAPAEDGAASGETGESDASAEDEAPADEEAPAAEDEEPAANDGN